MKNANIMKRMAYDNLLFIEARKQVEGLVKDTNSRPSVNMKNFPKLLSKKSNFAPNYKDCCRKVSFSENGEVSGSH